jgi:septum formation inhibitor MinC
MLQSLVIMNVDIHVYGALRGRALAGLAGNASARIFATRFDAELVGIADVYRACEVSTQHAYMFTITVSSTCHVTQCRDAE